MRANFIYIYVPFIYLFLILFFYFVVAIATKRFCERTAAFLWLFRERQSCRFGVVRVMFGIPKRVTLLVFGPCRIYFRHPRSQSSSAKYQL